MVTERGPGGITPFPPSQHAAAGDAAAGVAIAHHAGLAGGFFFAHQHFAAGRGVDSNLAPALSSTPRFLSAWALRAS